MNQMHSPISTMRLLACLTLLSLAGCVPLEPVVQVASPPELEYRIDLVGLTVDGNTVALPDPPLDSSPSNRFVDSTISILWRPGPTQIGFVMDNLTARSIRVVWDDSAFIKQDGTASRIIHEGVLLAERTTSQPPSVVPAGGTISDFVLAVDNIEYSDYSGWTESPYITPEAVVFSYDENAESPVGDRIGVLLALDVNGERREYRFAFEVGALVEVQY